MFLMLGILVTVIIAGMLSWTYPQQGGAPFSLLTDDIGKGVPGSYSGIPAGPDLRKQIYVAPLGALVPTYYGNGIPLVDRPPGIFENRVTPHHNPKCAPECCPSPYSCDRGCLCVDLKGLKWPRPETR